MNGDGGINGLAESGRGPEIDSWKQIAAHFGVTVRTAQLWEQEQGMPVRRMPGGRGRVYARVEELEQWRRLRGQAKPLAEESVGGRAWVGVAALAGLLVLGGALFVGAWAAGGTPSLSRVEGRFLVVMDAKGTELWRYGLAAAPKALERIEPLFVDVDGDDRPEVLYAHERYDTSEPDELMCFSARGRRMWTFRPGRAVRTAKERFANHYRLRAVEVLPAERGMPVRVLVIARHEPDYPAQVVALDGAGRVRAEYWHSGHVVKTLVTDLDGDGANEILLAGIANGSKCGDLVVLDAARFGGTSREENADYQILGMATGEERARILFPRTKVARRLDRYGVPSALLAAGDEVQVHLSEMTAARVGTSFAYVFSRGLRLLRVGPGDSTKAAYEAMKAEGIVPADFQPDTMEELRAVKYEKEYTGWGGGR